MKPKGKKNDAEKVPLQLIPGNALLEVGKVLREGAKKYSAHNWRGGLEYSRLTGACFRHLTAFNEGEDLDPETQLSHIAHLACEALFLLEFITKERSDLDDRYKGSKVLKTPSEPVEQPARVFLRNIRESLDLSQTDLALLVGMSQAAIANFETGKRPISRRTAKRLARCLGCIPEALMSERDAVW